MHWNPAFVSFFERAPHDGDNGDTLARVCGRFRWDGPDGSFESTPIARAAAAGTPLSGVEVGVEDARGERRVLRVSLRPFPLRDGRGIVCVFEDATELRRVEAVRRYAEMLDEIHDAVIATDLEGRVTFWSKGAERVYGYPAEEAIGRHVSFLYLPEDVEMLERDVLGPLFAKGEHALEKRTRRKSGDVIFVHLSLAVLRDADGTVTGAIGFSIDVTERRRAEEALRASEERLRLAFGAAKIFAWDWDVTSDVVISSTPVGELLGYEGRHADDYRGHVHPDDRAAVAAAVARALAGESFFEQQYRMIFADGTLHWIDTRAYVQRDRNGRATRLVGVGRDVTAEKQAAAEREQLLGAAERTLVETEAASRGKDEFLAMLGHELRNPLGAARNAVVAAQFDGGQRERALDIARRQIDQLARLVDDLLDVARVTRGAIHLRKEPIALNRVVWSALDSVRASLEDQGHALGVSLPPEPIHLEADPTRLEQILVNLLGNAVKYTPPGGRIEVGAAREAGDVVITVRDNGVGIAPDVLPRVFELFAQSPQTLDRARGGLGIGLTIVRRLVTLHGGTVEARSAGLGRGAEFVVRLPASPPAGDVDAPVRSPAPQARRLRILVVEDNHEAAEALRMLLESFGEEIRVVYHGVAALEAVRRAMPDVVLLDIGLPGIDGYEVARQLRSRAETARLVLVAVTGYGRDEDKARALAAGFDAHLTKPVDVECLRQLLADVAASRLGRDADAAQPARVE